MDIHPSSVISPQARLGNDVVVGPFCVIEAGARIGDRCRLDARATVKAGVTLGEDNRLGEGTVLGALAQHLRPSDTPGDVQIGNGNTFRENTTVHRAMNAGSTTSIGNGCLLMVGAHVAHDCTVGSDVILTNNVMLGGHVEVGDRACLGGGVAVHQHCRVGRLAMIGGMARIVQDVLPFVMIDGSSGMVVGLNRVGIRRAGIDRHEAKALKEAYQIIYRSGASLEERLEALETEFPTGPAAEYASYLRGGSRGFVRERRMPPGGTIRPIHEALEERSDKKTADQTQRLAG